MIPWQWRRSMAGGKKAQKNQKDDLNLKNQKDNLSLNNPDILRRKNQENLFQKQLQENLQQILEYPHCLKDHWTWIQTLECPPLVNGGNQEVCIPLGLLGILATALGVLSVARAHPGKDGPEV